MNKSNTVLLLTSIEAALSVLFLTPDSRANKTCWQHVTACDTRTVYIKTWFMCLSPGFLSGCSGGHATSAGRLRGLVSTQRSATPVEGSEWKAEKRNWHALMRPYSLFLLFITSQKENCMSGLHMCGVLCSPCRVQLREWLLSLRVALGGGGLQQLLHPVTTMWQ